MLKENIDFIDCNVLRNAKGCDYTNGGVSSRVERVYICREGVTYDEVQEFCKENPYYGNVMFFVVDAISLGDETYIRATNLSERAKGNWTMSGGNYAYSCDSRYKEITGISYPISLHDRVE